MSQKPVFARDKREINEVGDGDCEHEVLRNIRDSPEMETMRHRETVNGLMGKIEGFYTTGEMIL